MKMLVDELPKNSASCVFSEYIGMTSKHACMFKHGLYSRCSMECGEKCPFLSIESTAVQSLEDKKYYEMKVTK